MKRNKQKTVTAIIAVIAIGFLLLACDGNGDNEDKGETRIVNGVTYVRAPNVDKEEFERVVEHLGVVMAQAPAAVRTNITKIEVKEPGTPISHSAKTVTVGSDVTTGGFMDYVIANNLNIE